MPDIDVGVVSLATPPASAPRTSYRPAVSVRNNGVKPAQAGGRLSIHDVAAGRLVLQLELPALPIQPGATRQLPADADWSPTVEDIGRRFLFTTWVSCPGDMVPANNYLTALVTVTGETPPTPPVAKHASQHEDGGSDELDATGLSGRLREPQTPTAHAADHQDGGADEIALDAMSGKLKDPQTPDVHGNIAHTVPYCALEDAQALVAAHDVSPTAHPALERTANKGTPSGYAGLNQNAHVPPSQLALPLVTGTKFLSVNFDIADPETTWADPPAASYAPPGQAAARWFPSEGTDTDAARADHRHDASGSLEAAMSTGGKYFNLTGYNLKSWTIPANLLHKYNILRVELWGYVFGDTPPVTADLTLKFGPTAASQLCRVVHSFATGNHPYHLHVTLLLLPNATASNGTAVMSMLSSTGADAGIDQDVYDVPAWNWDNTVANILRLVLTINGDVSHYLSLAGWSLDLAQNENL